MQRIKIELLHYSLGDKTETSEHELSQDSTTLLVLGCQRIYCVKEATELAELDKITFSLTDHFLLSFTSTYIQFPLAKTKLEKDQD